VTSRPRDDELRADAVRAARAIEGWLWDSGVQLADGPHRGAVAGWLDRDGRPEYAYPEITGYFLVYAAWLMAGGAGSGVRGRDAARRARQAVGWLLRATADGSPLPTRIYLDGPRRDWRNAATFSFDLAMAARGAGCFAMTAGDEDADRLTRELAERLRVLAGDDTPLRSHAELSATRLPRRWSTLPGPHHAKAAAAVLQLPADTVHGVLRTVCERTVAHWSPARLSSRIQGDLHPLLYCLEGALLIGACNTPRLRTELAGAYERLMAHQRADGSLPGSLSPGQEVVRADVLAQALRVGALVRSRGALDGDDWRRRLDGLARALCSHIRADGSVAFHHGDGRGNAWAAMFAHQALVAYVREAEGKAQRDDIAVALLI
jgi:hypothetical protein